MRKSFLIAGLLFALWGLISALSYDAAFLSTALTQYLAGGRTFSKEYFFLGWGLLLFLVLAYAPVSVRRNSGRLLLGIVVLLHGMNLSLHLWFNQRVGVPFTAYTVTASGQTVSSNSLIHTHVFKGMLTLVLRSVGIGPETLPADPGAPFVELFPAPLVWLSLFLTLLAIGLALKVALERRNAWSERRTWPLWVGLTVSYYVVLRTIVDGGPLCTDFLVYFPPFVLLTIGPRHSAFSLIKRSIPWWIAEFALLAVLNIFGGFETYHDLLLDLVLLSVFFSALVLVTEWFAAGAAGVGVRNLFWLLPLLVGMSFDHYFVDDLKFVRTKLSPGDRIYALAYDDTSYPFPLLYSEGPVRVYTDIVTEPSSIWDIVKRFRVPPSRICLGIEGKTCFPDRLKRMVGTIKVWKKGRPGPGSTPGVFKYFRLENCSPGESCDYRFQTALDGCIPNRVFFPVVGHLSRLGFKTFTISLDAP